MDEDVGIIIRVKDLASKALNAICKSTNCIVKGMRRLLKATFKLKGMRQVFSDLTRSLAGVSMALADTHQQFSRMARIMFKATFGLAAMGIKIAGDTEEANARLGFALTKIGKQYDEVVKKIDKVSLATVLTRKELTDMVSTLAIQKIDAFDSALDTLAFTARDGTQGTISAMEVLNDAVAFSGKTVQRVMFSVKEAVSEQKIRPGRLLADDLNLTRKELELWNKTLKEAGSNQQAFNDLMQLMATRVGGMSQSLNNTLNFVLKQVSDWRDKIVTDIFGPSLREIAGFVQDAGKSIIQMVNAKKFAPIAEAVRQVVSAFVSMAQVVHLVTLGVVELTARFPFLIHIMTAVASFTILMAGALAGVLAIVAPLAAIAGLFALIGVLILSIKALILGAFAAAFLLPLLGILLAIPVALASIFSTQLKAKGFMDMWERFKLVVTAVVEGVRNMNGNMTHLSTTTARALSKKGLLGFVEQILLTISQSRIMFNSMRESMEKLAPRIMESLKPLMAAAERFAQTLGIDLEEGIDQTMGAWEKRGVSAANAIVGVLTTMLEIMTELVMMGEAFMGVFSRDIDAVRIIRNDKDIQKKIQEGLIPVRKGQLDDLFNIKGFFTRSKSTLFDFKRPGELTSEEEGSAVTTLARSMQREGRRKSLARVNKDSAFMAAIAAGEDPTGLGAPIAALGPNVKKVMGALDAIQSNNASVLRSRIQDSTGVDALSQETEQNTIRLYRIVGKVIADEIIRRDALKVKLNNRDMMDQINEGAEAAYDGAR